MAESQGSSRRDLQSEAPIERSQPTAGLAVEAQRASRRRAPVPVIDKTEVATLRCLAEAAWREFDKRRSYEWKVNFALWTALAAFAGFAFGTTFAADQQQLLARILLTVGLTYTFVWSGGIYAHNARDQRAAALYWSRIEHLIPDLQPRLFDEAFSKYKTRSAVGRLLHRVFGPLFNWSHLSQILVTWLFVTLALRAAGTTFAMLW